MTRKSDAPPSSRVSMVMVDGSEGPLSTRTARPGFFDWLLGKRLSSDDDAHECIGTTAGIAILGLDGLSSAGYGPEAALTLLLPLGVLGLRYIGPISALIIGLLFIVYFSYRQTINAYPSGGGSYTVAKENLGKGAALLAGAALAIDYILNVAVGVSAGVGALVSAVPSMLSHRLAICLAILLLLTIVNLRGVRESGRAFMVPTYAFVGTLGIVIIVGCAKAFASGGHPTPVAPLPAPPVTAEALSLWILLRSFASGCTAMTGVEAVSNGVPIFKKPTVPNAQRTLTFIILILAALLGGIAFLSRVYGINATDPDSKDYQSVLSMLVGAVFGRGPFYYVTLGSVVTVLALSANTSFAGFPRLCRVLAEDRYLPDSFAVRGRRLVFSYGIILLSVLAGALLVGFRGITDRLIPLFAIGAFLAFTMSQAGMVQHWRRLGGADARHSLPINAIGAVATGITLVIVAVSKFIEGAWVIVLVVPLLVLFFMRVNKHYADVAVQVKDDKPLELSESAKPVVVIAAQSWNKLTERGLAFGLRLSPHVYAIQVQSTEVGKMRDLTAEWERLAAGPARAAGLAEPKLVVLTSRYREFFKPLIDFVLRLREDNPRRDIVVVIPDLVVTHWYHALLHNHRGAILRTLLRLRGGPRVVVVNTPFYLHDLS